MERLEALDERFGIPGAVRFERGAGGLACVRVITPVAEGQLYLHGAHVTHYRPVGQAPVLFLSSRSRFAPGRAIRGGVPLIFPWFGARADDPAAPEHGFARTTEWSVEGVEGTGAGPVAITLALEASAATRATWPHEFRLCYRAVFGAELELTLEVENRSREDISVEEALHTYLHVGDVSQVPVTGLEAARYIDKVDGMARKVHGQGALRLAGPTDRVFLDTRSACVVEDPVLGRRLVVDKHGSASTVVWNPWAERALAMADLGPDEWRSMLCVETANAADDAVSLAGGARHAMRAVIRSIPA